MTDYINIKGQNIEVVSSDPSNPTLGQIWYNSTSQTLKGLGFAAGSWASATSMNTARTDPAGAGTQTEALAFGGLTPGGPTGATEAYNGTSWTAGGSLNTARQFFSRSWHTNSSISFWWG
jgi:hypothetical protein